ncbi:MAG: hypothetical protein WCP22_05710 [Chlamydiota bacterium]
MTHGRVSLNVLIAVEASVLLLLMGLLLAFLPSLREETRSGAATPVPAGPALSASAPAEPAVEAALPHEAQTLEPHGLSHPPPSSDLPVANLRSSRLMKGLKAVPVSGDGFVSSAPATVKIEPAREMMRESAVDAPIEEPSGAAAGAGDAKDRIPM